MAPIRRGKATKKEATGEEEEMGVPEIARSAPMEVEASSAQPKRSRQPEDGGVVVEPEPEQEGGVRDDECDSLTVELERLFLSKFGVPDESCVVRQINDEVQRFERRVSGFVKDVEKLAFPDAGLAGSTTSSRPSTRWKSYLLCRRWPT